MKFVIEVADETWVVTGSDGEFENMAKVPRDKVELIGRGLLYMEKSLKRAARKPYEGPEPFEVTRLVNR